MGNETLDTSLLDRAILFAVEAHRGTARRGKRLPYIVHSLEAMTIAASRFGERVASFVETESDDLSSGDTWHEKKRKSAARLASASREAKIVALGDKLSNMRAIARDYAARGEDFWNLFHVKDKSVHGARYRGLVDALQELSGCWAYEEFKRLVYQVFNEE